MERKSFTLFVIINILFYSFVFLSKYNQWLGGAIYEIITQTALVGWFWALSLGLVLRLRGYGESR